MSLLRQDLLAGRAVAVAGSPPEAVLAALSGHGARVMVVGDLGPGDEEQVGEWARRHRPLDALVYCAADVFNDGGIPGLVNTLQQTWQAVRELAVGALIEGESAGKIVLLGPPTDAGPAAPALVSALENLGRTLSVEWARYAITTVTVAPAADTGDAELAELLCFLCSTAGGYFSGCRLDLGTVAR